MHLMKVIIRLGLAGTTLYFTVFNLYKDSYGLTSVDSLMNVGRTMGNSILFIFMTYHFSQMYYDLKKQRKCVKVLYWLNCIPIALLNVVFLQRLIKQLSFSTGKNQILLLAPFLFALHVYDFIYYQTRNAEGNDLKDVIDF